MPDSTNPNRGWYQYTDDGARTWAMKVQKAWGDSGDSGFVAYGGGGPAFGSDPTFPMNVGRNRPRAIICENADTGRRTKVRVGSNAATAWTNKGYTFVSSAKGIAGAVNYVRVGAQSEHLLDAHAVRSQPEPAGV